VVEDNAGLRTALAAILEDLGYRVSTAATAEQASLLLADPAFAVDAVVSDVVLPDRSGTELVEHLRVGRPGLRALFISGTSGAAIQRRRGEPGDLILLEKPFSADSLGRALRGVLEGPA
jgi:DNA-binding NtrC family response regulator